VSRALKRAARLAGLIGAAAARRMSTPTPIVLVLVSIGLGFFGLRISGIESLQYKWVLAISILWSHMVPFFTSLQNVQIQIEKPRRPNRTPL
jgi:hypothetical protein